MAGSQYKLVVNIFLTGLSIIYLIAFASLYIQFPGLYGKEGLEPIHAILTKKSFQPWIVNLQNFLQFPSIFIFQIPLEPEVIGDIICIFGMALSASTACIQKTRCVPIMAMIWVFYLSIVNVGQTFMSFQWDVLLLEVGFVVIWMVPFFPENKQQQQSEYQKQESQVLMAPLLQLRFILFKLMLMSGVVKIQAYCPTWLNLTACHYHFATQPLPTPPAWFFHQLPGWFQKLQVAGTFVIEIPATLLILSPFSNVRLLAAGLQLMLQSFIVVTGNYNFFNLLTMLLCISLFQDSLFTNKAKIQNGQKIDEVNQKNSISLIDQLNHEFNEFLDRFNKLAMWASIIFLVVCVFYMFNMSEKGLELILTVEQLNYCVRFGLPYILIVWGFVMLLYGSIDIVSSLQYRNFMQAIWRVLVVGVVLLVYLKGIIAISHLDQQLSLNVIKWPLVEDVQQIGHSWHLSSGYGLFRRMTGVGDVQGAGKQVQRPEIIIEGSTDNVNWAPIEFEYKPGPLSKSPPWVAPHQPRLDWQMWFAALGSYHSNHWFIHLIYRLLRSSEPVYNLIAKQQKYQQFSANNPPKFIRAQLFYYEFSQASWGRERLDPSGKILEFNNSNNDWWTKVYVREYFPVISVNDSQIVNFLRQKKWIGVKHGMGTAIYNYRKQIVYLDYGLGLVQYILQVCREFSEMVVFGFLFFPVTVWVYNFLFLKTNVQQKDKDE